MTLAATAGAAEIQRLDVRFADDTAVLHVTKNTKHKFVTATITSLQQAGTDKFSLHALDQNDKTDITSSAVSINITDGVTEITAAVDLPQKVLVSLINQLKEAGITKVKIAALKISDGASESPAPH